MKFLNVLSFRFQLRSSCFVNKARKGLWIVAVAIVLCPFSFSFSSAMEPTIDITNAWVEEGYEFYVTFEATPSNESCAITGEGFIEFEVDYVLARSNQVDTAFGLAIWYPSSSNESTIITEAKANGPQGFCTRMSPCRIRNINVVKTWCPISEEQIWPAW